MSKYQNDVYIVLPLPTEKSIVKLFQISTQIINNSAATWKQFFMFFLISTNQSTMYTYNSDNTIELNLNNAKTIGSLDLFYQSIKYTIDKAFIFLIVLFILTPFIFLVGLWLRKKRKNFQKLMRIDSVNLESVDDYVKFKNKLNQVSELMPILTKVTRYDQKNSPIFIRFTTKQMKKLSSTVLTYSTWLKSKLDKLNTASNLTKNTAFTFTSEAKLWENRNKAYNYWM